MNNQIIEISKMIKFIKKGLVAAVLLITVLGYADVKKSDYILRIDTGNGKIVSFAIEDLQNAAFFIYDQNHNLIYEGGSIEHTMEISKTVSLTGYPAGTYFLKVTGKEKSVEHEFKVAAKNSKIVRMDKSVNDSPSLRR